MNKKRNDFVGILLLIAGIAAMVLGISQGEHTEVFQKAIRICLECIGIG